MIIQPYAFKGEFDETYAKARAFLVRLRDAGMSVTLPDGFRSNTKTYPDYDRSVTVIEVFPDISVDEQIETIEKIFADIMAKPEPEDSADVVEAKRLIANMDLGLEWSEGEGWMLRRPGCAPDEVVFWGVPENKMLRAVKRHLGLLRPDGESVLAGDDFDPFLPYDENNLP